MDSLDLPTHQLILDDLAVNLASDIDRIPAGSAHVRSLFGLGAGAAATSSRVKTSSLRHLSTAAARTQISLALFASSISTAQPAHANDEHLVPVLDQLESLLRDLTLTDFDQDMAWSEWPLADQLAHALVASFLRVAQNAQHHRRRCFDAVLVFADRLTAGLTATSGDAHTAACRLVPLFNGLYRALANVRFPWSRSEFARLATTLAPLIRSVQAARRLDEILLVLPEQQLARAHAIRSTRRVPKQPTVRPKDALGDDRSEGSVDTFFSGNEDDVDGDDVPGLVEQDGGFTYADGDSDEDQRAYRLSMLAHYRRIGSPVSGHYAVHAALEILTSVLAQALAVDARPRANEPHAARGAQADRFDLDPALLKHQRHHGHLGGDKAAAEAWKSLLRYAVVSPASSSEADGKDATPAIAPAASSVPASAPPTSAQPGEQGGLASAVLSAIPLLGSSSTNGSAAFGHDQSTAPSAASNGAPAISSLLPTALDVDAAVHSTIQASNRTFHSTQRFVESAGYELDGTLADLYTADILGEALKLSTLCSVCLHLDSGTAVDASTFVRIRNLLSESTPIIDPTVQTAALQSVGLLVRNQPAVAMPMTRVLRHFVTSPLAVFESGPNGTLSPVLLSAARCLASCVTIAPGDDLVVSTMYNLLNYISKDSAGGGAGGHLGLGGLASSGMSVRSGASRAITTRDHIPGMQHSGSQTIMNVRTEDQKRLINLSTITVLARLALEVGKPDITALTVSMLLQRLRTADPVVEAAILDNLVPLALAGPKAAYVDVIRALSSASRSAMTGGANRRAAVAVHAAQLKLATGLGRLDESDDRERGGERDAADGGPASSASAGDDLEAAGGRKELYLVELLQLYAEKGIQLQQAAASGKSSAEELAELNTDLAAMLPSIAALLEHADINPQVEPTTEMVTLFRNLWFLSVLFGFASPQNIRSVGLDRAAAPRAAPASAAEAQGEIVGRSLSAISLKTPTLVPETAHNYLESDLEYNSVLKREFSSATLDSQRKALAAVIPSHASEIRSFSYAQVTFLATIYDLESLRSRMGRPSMVLWYFVNDGLNSSTLVSSMQAIADRVVDSYIQDLGRQVDGHTLDPRVSSEVRALLLGTCHRVAKVRQVSQSILDKLVGALPSLLCDQDVVVAMLEILTLLRQGCECEYRDEYAPVYHFRSERANLSFELSDSYSQRNEILARFLERARRYLGVVLGLAPVELHGILQRYLSTFDDSTLPGRTELGKSVALDYARAMPASSRGLDGFLPQLGGWKSDASSVFVGELSAKSTYLGEMTGIHLALSHGLVELAKDPTTTLSPAKVAESRDQLRHVAAGIAAKRRTPPFAELRRLLYRSAALAVALPRPDYELLHFIVAIPMLVFSNEAVSTACQVWTWIIGERPEVETKVMVEITAAWSHTARTRRGLFSPALTQKHPFLRKTEMGAFDREEVTAEQEQARRLFTPHLTLIHLLSSRFQALRYRDPTMVLALHRLIQHSGNAVGLMSTHPLSREVRFSLVLFGFELLQGSRAEGLVEHQLRDALYRIAFAWFAAAPQWSFGSNRLQLRAEIQLLSELLDHLRVDRVRTDHHHLTSFASSSASTASSVRLPPHGITVAEAAQASERKRTLLRLLLENEQARFSVWANPLGEGARGSDYVGELTKSMTEARWPELVRSAWSISPAVAVQLGVRFQSSKALRAELGRLVRAQPQRVVDVPTALQYVLEDHLSSARRDGTDLRWLQYWSAVSPVEAIHLFQPEYDNHPLVLQYAMRALEQHPVELTFFYVPQVVQALRDDAYGYVEHFIFETSKISQLFCHQIIWNMKANSYRDDDAEEPDPMKPTLDRMVDNIVNALSGEAQEFYEREFGFFNEVTSISGKLKPYIKKSKPEKKAKIDEEMAKIKVEEGVYLPSNADGVVVDLDRKSGRPLQSHAKAPFMATFKVRREVARPGGDDADEGGDGDENGGQGASSPSPAGRGEHQQRKRTVDVWQGAIFKVGDDCRQDVLALQVIAMFKNIYTTVGIDLYLNPYRVTATGPGCGVIDVVPNATSRDEMGRAKINNLLAFFLGRYGNPDSVAFQRARINFIQSMAAYSVVCHILQIRDRHNGNMMIDGDGHLVHIDFGFLFDIGPGGMRFEPYSFKLSHEMIDVMGGPGSQGFKMFEELVVKAFLAARPYCNEIVDVCRLMLGTELPSFKGMPTIDRLRDRFKPHLSDREAAAHAQWLVKDAYGNMRGVLYDKLQEVTNDIPFAR
ncbi:related to phosphatidylinositol-4-kinase [Pseudozyma flocculosa]|uniref:1-phosphatidylinositol 4-kinase n=1 Tax=Pseudozyma flocculosa TaxID=84751 RepID=A0A5C3F0X2_9BASI|nr:related to phosphatidylinositol-4-kinase [Pseudozyma flocculosa]